MSISSNKQSSFRRAKKAVIFGAGEYFDEMPFIPADAYVIAADGGYDHVTALGVTPHAFIGETFSWPQKLQRMVGLLLCMLTI